MKYQGIEYPTRRFEVILNGDETIITIGTEGLQENLGDKVNDLDTLEAEIDSEIYHYIDIRDLRNLSGAEICKTKLDTVIEFVSELSTTSKEDQLKEQVKLLEEIQSHGINVVTCGNCGTVILHRTERAEIECFDCGNISEQCDYPDLFYR